MWAPAGGLLGPRAGLRALLCGRDAALLPGRARALHGSAVACGSKNLLKKFASKSKKKFWYEGPSLGSHLTHTPSKLELMVKSTARKTRKEDHVRLRTLNGLLYKALTDLLCTPEVSQEVCDLHLELSKVSLTSDFSACRVYWKTTLSAEQNAHARAVLQRSAPHMRHLLMTQQTVRNMPPIVFVQDKANAALAEIDQLLAGADFGPPDGEHAPDDSRDPDAPPLCDTAEPATHSSLCGIDHQALSKQIMEYKRRREGRLGGAAGPGPAAELAKLMAKGKKKARPRAGQDSSLRSYLAGGDDLDDGRP
ncbi:putative ribosome-binding factor A, mitochondrial isoform X1 [Lemur catta]|uniref:putative ribosome-binding factor A, mitochondrial isoform X1 n=2 Tax=Lemur catta TaxID=9447 RepID=UPI001E2670FC|nr:putative ribosome-binding factor A, mitochondrial isoform X1 [Lemur catta]